MPDLYVINLLCTSNGIVARLPKNTGKVTRELDGFNFYVWKAFRSCSNFGPRIKSPLMRVMAICYQSQSTTIDYNRLQQDYNFFVIDYKSLTTIREVQRRKLEKIWKNTKP